jgi:hypothetical protein
MAEESGLMSIMLEYLVPLLVMGVILALFFIARHLFMKRFGRLFETKQNGRRNGNEDQQSGTEVNQQKPDKTGQVQKNSSQAQPEEDRPRPEIVKAADEELNHAQQLMVQFERFVEGNRADPPDDVAQNYEDAQRCLEIAVNSYLENEDMTGTAKFEAALRYLKEASRLIDDCGHKYEQFLKKAGADNQQ